MIRIFAFLYSLSLYSAVSMALASVQFLCAGVLVYLLSWSTHLRLFPGAAGLFSASCYDAAGFAFLTATNALLQYFLASLLSRDLKGGTARFGVVAFSALFSTMLFLRLAASSSFGAYAFAGVPILLSYLLGGAAGLLQKDVDNPFRGSRIRMFAAR